MIHEVYDPPWPYLAWDEKFIAQTFTQIWSLSKLNTFDWSLVIFLFAPKEHPVVVYQVACWWQVGDNEDNTRLLCNSLIRLTKNKDQCHPVPVSDKYFLLPNILTKQVKQIAPGNPWKCSLCICYVNLSHLSLFSQQHGLQHKLGLSSAKLRYD